MAKCRDAAKRRFFFFLVSEFFNDDFGGLVFKPWATEISSVYQIVSCIFVNRMTLVLANLCVSLQLKIPKDENNNINR